MIGNKYANFSLKKFIVFFQDEFQRTMFTTFRTHWCDAMSGASKTEAFAPLLFQ